MSARVSPKLCCLLNPYGVGKLCWEDTLRRKRPYNFFKHLTMTQTHTYESLMVIWEKHDKDWKWRSKKKMSYAKESVLLLCKDLGLEPEVPK